MFSLSELKNEFLLIKESSYEGIKGVMVFDSGIPGPCLGITINTHGNEPSGLAALGYFRKDDLVKSLISGRVMFVINNIQACEAYFKALEIENVSERETAKLKSRFCDVNMNRLPTNTLELSGDKRYEILRAQELRQVWERFDIAFDVHSTRSESEPMIIALGNVQSTLYAGFPIGIIIRNIENVQSGKPASAFYGRAGETPVFAIETGSHEKETSFQTAMTCISILLQNLGMLPKTSLLVSKTYKEYLIVDSMFFPDNSYELTKAFNMFELCEKGQIIAQGNGPAIVAPETGCLLFVPPGKKPTAPLDEEVLFFSAPPRIIKA
ncbi:MAG: succinylglutamate desuccinylase/aspartoacylase family protein [Patescibacteria group bacterium]